MRIWTLHPKFLDVKGLVALWREGLLAKAVLEGKTKGYLNHPQLIRFRAHDEPVAAICEYLRAVHDEAKKRSYRFDATKLPPEPQRVDQIEESNGQLNYEWQHLLRKLEVREPETYQSLIANNIKPEAHPAFTMNDGEIREWERVS